MGSKTQTSESSPWQPAQSRLITSMEDADKLYKQGIGGRSWTGLTTAPMSRDQTGGLDSMRNVATGFQPWMNSAAGRLDSIANSATSNPDLAQARGYMQAAVGGYGAPSTGNIDAIGAAGMRGAADPAFNQALDIASRKAREQVDLSASGAGRYGSGIHQGNVAREIADIQTGARANQYNIGQDRALSAFGASAGIQGQNADRRIGAANNLFGYGQNDVANRLNAFDRMGSAYDLALRPGQTSYDIGQLYRDEAQNVLNDQMRQFDDSQNLPWQQLARYNAIAQGMGGLGGTTTQRQQRGFGDFLGSLIGLAGAF